MGLHDVILPYQPKKMQLRYLLFRIACVLFSTLTFVNSSAQIQLSDSYINAPLTQSAIQLPPLIPAHNYVADWAGNGGYQISPDGKHMLWSARKGLKPGLFVKDLMSGEVHSYNIPFLGVWAKDSQHILFNVSNGDENGFILELDASDRMASLRNMIYQPKHNVVLVSQIDGSRDFYVKSNQREEKIFDLYRFDAEKSKLEMVDQNPGDVIDWYFNQHGELVMRIKKETEHQSVEELQDDKTWAYRFNLSLTEEMNPIKYSPDKKIVWALSNRGRDKLALVKLYLIGGHEEVIQENDEADILVAIINSFGTDVLATMAEPDHQVWNIFSPSLKKFLEPILQAKAHINVLSTDEEQKKIIFYIKKDSGGEFVLFNTENLESEILGITSLKRIQKIGAQPLQQTVQFKGIDGLNIHGFVVRPVDINGFPLLKVPTVVLVHGGPWSRDFMYADKEAYFLANRGYAVLQVNFRSSTGYGKVFEELGKGEFANKIQGDLNAGVQYLVQQGITDSERVAIMGASFGGYSALVGMTHYPKRYACAISINGVTDMTVLQQQAPAYWFLRLFKWSEYAGDSSTEDGQYQLHQISPIYKADKVEGPILMIQGAKDVRVQVTQAKRMVEMLHAANKKVEYLEFKNIGHNIYSGPWPSILTVYRRTEDFLAQCLGGRTAGYDWYELGNFIF